MSMSMRWDWSAIGAGALIAFVLGLPLAIGARIAADGDHEGVAIGLSIAATVAFGAGAACAAWLQRAATPLSHGLVTAGGTYLVVQAVLIAVRLVRGEDVHWFSAAFTLTFVLFAGLLGGLAGQRLRSAGIVPAHLDRRER
jgi:hypothetical protein